MNGPAVQDHRMNGPAVQDASLNLLWIARVLAFLAFLLIMSVLVSGHCDVNIIVLVLSLGKSAQSVWWASNLQSKDAKSNHAGSHDSTPARRDQCKESRTRQQPELAPWHAAAPATVSKDKHAIHPGKHGKTIQRSSKMTTALVPDAASHHSRGKASVQESDHVESAGLKPVRHDRSHNHVTMTPHSQDKGRLRKQPVLVQAAASGTFSVNKPANRLSPKYYCGEKMQRPSGENAVKEVERRWVSCAVIHFPERSAIHSSQKSNVQITSPANSPKKPQPKSPEDASGLPALQLARSLPLDQTFSTISLPVTFPKTRKLQPNGKCQANGSGLTGPRLAREMSPSFERTLNRATFSLDAATPPNSSGVRFYTDVVSRARAAQLASRAQAAQCLRRCKSV